MTIFEIEKQLKSNYSLTFIYISEYYTLIWDRFFLCSRYSLFATDAVFKSQKSLEELCGRTYLLDGVLLADAIKSIVIPRYDDPCWKTYEAVRHSAIIQQNEISFNYDERNYWITHPGNSTSYLTDDYGNSQIFKSCRDLFEFASIDGKSLREIWNDVIVYTC